MESGWFIQGDFILFFSGIYFLINKYDVEFVLKIYENLSFGFLTFLNKMFLMDKLLFA